MGPEDIQHVCSGSVGEFRTSSGASAAPVRLGLLLWEFGDPLSQDVLDGQAAASTYCQS